jgi:hypothetical protein
MMRESLYKAVLAAMLLATAGCGDGSEASVGGVVTLDGQPLNRGTVSFIPESGGAGATAAIGSDGSFEARTGSTIGLQPGDYAITVRAREDSVQPAKGGLPMPGKLITPKKYDSSSTSGLRATINSGKNELQLELRSDAA